MKKYVRFLFFGLLFTVLTSFAQDKTPEKSKAGRYVSEKGYWNIESNQKTPRNSIIRFYNIQNQLVYEEAIQGMKVRINKRKVLLCLKNVLEQSVLAYEQNHSASQGQMLFMQAFKK